MRPALHSTQTELVWCLEQAVARLRYVAGMADLADLADLARTARKWADQIERNLADLTDAAAGA